MRRLGSEPLARCAAPLALLCAALGAAPAGAQPNLPVFDIGTSGTATLTGAINGSVIVNPNLLYLEVTLSFGELSPVNRSALVRAVIPVIIRTEAEYQLAGFVTASNFGTGGDALALSDIGMGIINVRPLAKGQLCPGAPHTVYPPFNTDPGLSYTLTPRVAFAGNLSLLTIPRVVLTGPRASNRSIKLTPGNIPASQRDNGWTFDLILTAAPQFFTTGSGTATLAFTISQGPTLACQ